MVWHGSTYIVPQDRSFRGTLYYFGQVDSVPRGLAVFDLKAHFIQSLARDETNTCKEKYSNLLKKSQIYPLG